MEALTKTEKIILSRIKNDSVSGYQGKRELNAVKKLVAKGLLKYEPKDGSYLVRRSNGDYIKKYSPQGKIYAN